MDPLLVRVSALAVAVAATSYSINRVVPEPYLVRPSSPTPSILILLTASRGPQDEEFHIPQAQAYCRNAFDEWDPKLTTPAGLYLLSYPLGPLGLCSPPFLRGVNAAAVVLLLPAIVYRIQRELHASPRARARVHTHAHAHANARAAAAQTAVNVALFPLIFFFGGLFYTDVWSTVLVLAAYLATLRDRAWAAALLAWLALWFRQTNVVWVVFMAGVCAVRTLERLQSLDPARRRRGEGAGRREAGQEPPVDLAVLLAPQRWAGMPIHNPPVGEDSPMALTGKPILYARICSPVCVPFSICCCSRGARWTHGSDAPARLLADYRPQIAS